MTPQGIAYKHHFEQDHTKIPVRYYKYFFSRLAEDIACVFIPQQFIRVSYETITLSFVIETFYNKMCRQIAEGSLAVWTRFILVSWYICLELCKYIIGNTRGNYGVPLGS